MKKSLFTLCIVAIVALFTLSTLCHAGVGGISSFVEKDGTSIRLKGPSVQIVSNMENELTAQGWTRIPSGASQNELIYRFDGTTAKVEISAPNKGRKEFTFHGNWAEQVTAFLK